VDLNTILEGLAEVLAPKIAAMLAARGAGEPSTRYATAKDNPLGTARAFADAARRGDFPTFKRGRCVAARWADVEAYIEGRPCARKPRQRPPAPPARVVPLDPTARRLADLRAAGAIPADEPAPPRRRAA
jgi:hypothetical protein